jgi:hypothetical protein
LALTAAVVVSPEERCPFDHGAAARRAACSKNRRLSVIKPISFGTVDCSFFQSARTARLAQIVCSIPLQNGSSEVLHRSENARYSSLGYETSDALSNTIIETNQCNFDMTRN